MNYEVFREILTAQIQSDVYSGQRDTQQFEGKKKKIGVKHINRSD